VGGLCSISARRSRICAKITRQCVRVFSRQSPDRSQQRFLAVPQVRTYRSGSAPSFRSTTVNGGQLLLACRRSAFGDDIGLNICGCFWLRISGLAPSDCPVSDGGGGWGKRRYRLVAGCHCIRPRRGRPLPTLASACHLQPAVHLGELLVAILRRLSHLPRQQASATSSAASASASGCSVCSLRCRLDRVGSRGGHPLLPPTSVRPLLRCAFPTFGAPGIDRHFKTHRSRSLGRTGRISTCTRQARSTPAMTIQIYEFFIELLFL